MNASGKTVVVIGGGVVGVASAHYLNKAGWKVVVVDKGTIGGGSSWGNCGYVCPSHVLPLAEPGMVGEGLASLFRKDSPLKIRLRPDPALWAWLVRFALRCNHEDMMEAARGIQALLDSSLGLYHELMRDEALDCEWQTRGLLFVYRDRTAFEAYAKIDRLLAEHFHSPARRLEGDEVLEIEPALKPGLAGGWYYHEDAHFRPERLMKSWRANLQGRGVEFRENCGFEGFDRLDGRAVSARTERGPIAADAFVLAAGAWTPKLNDGLGCRIPIQPGKGYSLTTPRPKVCPETPMIFPETRVAVTPFRSGYRLGSLMEFAGYDDRIDPARLALLGRGAAPFLREPEGSPIEETWTGWRPMTWDGLPIIDRAPALPNVVIAAGHNMLGVSMATGSGKLVADILSGSKAAVDPRPYRATRF